MTLGATRTIRRDLPDIAPRVTHRGAAIAIGHVGGSFQRFGTGRDRTAAGGIPITPRNIYEGRHQVPDATPRAHHHHRMHDAEVAGAVRPEVALGGAEHLPE